MTAAPDPILDIVRPPRPAPPTLAGFHRLLAQPAFWQGLVAARNKNDPHDGRLISSYENAAAALSAMPEAERATCDPASIAEIRDWLERRMRNERRAA